MNQQSIPFLTALAATFGDRWRRDEPLSAHTTLRLGGPAEAWLAVESVAELVSAVEIARQHQVSLFLLGSGANLLVSDAGLRGLVVENRAGRVDLPAPEGRPGEAVSLTAESGVVLPNLARRCAKRGLAGLEWAVGVPGTIGGALVNNAGAFGGDMAGNLTRVELLSPRGERRWQPVAWMEYEYRQSRLKRQPAAEKWIVLQAELGLIRAPEVDIKVRMNGFNERRKASQPPGATIGSMFKNPPGDYAGRLIEAAGLRGHQQGQARISPVHANFFQNLGGATATDVVGLIRTAREAVEQKFGVELALEIELVGEFAE